MPLRRPSCLHGNPAPHSGFCASVQHETLLPFTKSRDILQLTVILNIALRAGLDTVRLTTRRMTILILFYNQMEIEFMVRYKKYKIRRLYDNYKR